MLHVDIVKYSCAVIAEFVWQFYENLLLLYARAVDFFNVMLYNIFKIFHYGRCNMNTLEIKKIPISKDYENECFIIDGIPFYEHLIKWYQESDWEEIQQTLASVDGLAITWTASFDNDGDARFMRWLFKKDKLNLPILSCPDDLDFSCIVIVAEVEKVDKYVLWKRIGKVNHSIENYEKEKRTRHCVCR